MPKNKKTCVEFYTQDTADYDAYTAALGEITTLLHHDQVVYSNQDISHDKIIPTPAPAIEGEFTPKSRTPARPNKGISEFSMAQRLVEIADVGIFQGALFVREGGVYCPLDSIKAVGLLQRHLPFEQADKLSMKLGAGIVDRVRTLDEVTSHPLEIPESTVLFLNGAFDIITGQRVELLSSDFVTVRVQANYRRKPDPTPVFDHFLEQCSGGNRSVAWLILTLFGYLLLPSAKAKKFFVLGTAPDSGKSLLAEFVRKLLSDETVCAICIHDFAEPFVVSQIVGKSVNFALDVPGGSLPRRTVSMLKTLTGRDAFSVNPKHEKPFRYVNTAKLVFGTNDPITIHDSDTAFWNRMQVIPFLHSVPADEQDIHLLDELWLERDGIVSLAMHAARKLIENDFVFPECAVAERMKLNWMGSNCTGLAEFVSTQCELISGTSTNSSVLYSAYCAWCADSGLRASSEAVFITTIKSVYHLEGYRRSSAGVQKRGVNGIQLKEIYEGN